ncbi:hypothetical protein ACFSTC_43365 [Nonomuraea ferruginea]
MRVTIIGDGGTARVAGRDYPVRFTSRHFREVVLEQDSVAGAVPFVSYHTGRLRGGPTGRLRGS